MGKIDWNSFSQQAGNASSVDSPRAVSSNRISYFFLRNDGEEAVARILINNPSDLEVVTVHQQMVNGKRRNVYCTQQDTGHCPLCEAGMQLSNKLYLPLTVYLKNEQGQVVPTPMIWERPASFGMKIANLCTEYGTPLSDQVFKIKRNGAPGSKQTSYDVLYANPSVYRPELYPKTEEAFVNYEVVGNAVVSLNDAQMQQLLTTGNIELGGGRSAATPATPAARPTYSTPVASTPAYAAPTTPAYSTPAVPTTPAVPAPNASYAAPRRTYEPQAAAATPATPAAMGEPRPRRFYQA